MTGKEVWQEKRCDRERGVAEKEVSQGVAGKEVSQCVAG